MKKIVLFLFFIALLNAAEDSYVFEAKGEFAKELKALVEKYKKDGKVEVTVYKKSDTKEKKTITQNILSKFTSTDAENLSQADITIGKKIYQTRCASCHGINANENKYANSRKLSTLKAIEIADLLKAYRDRGYGGSTKFIMKPQADMLLGSEMQSVAVYIYSLNHNTKTPTSIDSTRVEEEKEAPSSYLQ